MRRTHAEEVPAALPDKVSRRLSAVSATCRVGEAAPIITSGLPWTIPVNRQETTCAPVLLGWFTDHQFVLNGENHLIEPAGGRFSRGYTRSEPTLRQVQLEPEQGCAVLRNAVRCCVYSGSEQVGVQRDQQPRPEHNAVDHERPCREALQHAHQEPNRGEC